MDMDKLVSAFVVGGVLSAVAFLVTTAVHAFWKDWLERRARSEEEGDR